MSEHEHDNYTPEPDNTPAGALIVVVFAVLGLMAAAIVGMIPLVKNYALTTWWNSDYEARGGEELAEQRRWETEELTTYAQNDDGSYRVPIERAKALLVANPGFLAGDFPVFDDPNAAAEAAKLASVWDPAQLERGKGLYQTKICITCHSVDGSRLVGPSFKDLMGKEESLADGSTVTVDKAYIKTSIYDPNAQVVATYPAAMPPVLGGLSDAEFEDLFAFIASKTEGYVPEGGVAPAAGDGPAAGEALEGEGTEAEAATGELLEGESDQGVAADAEAVDGEETQDALASGAGVGVRNIASAEGEATPVEAEAAVAPAATPAVEGPVAAGQRIYTEKGCVACHSLDGSRGLGPSWQGIWGRTEELTDGTSVTVDEAYLRESVYQPTAKIVAGYAPVMPPAPGGLSEDEFQALIAYLKTL